MAIEHLRIETARLLLRPPNADDFAPYAAFCADPQAMAHLGGVQAASTAWRSLAAQLGSWHLQGFAMFSVIERSSGEWIGRVGPWRPHGWPGSEVGWSLRRASWGQGYAREAASAAIDWAFAQLGWGEVVHLIGPDNAPSQRLAAALGARLQRMAQLPPPHQAHTVEVWAQSRRDWMARR